MESAAACLSWSERGCNMAAVALVRMSTRRFPSVRDRAHGIELRNTVYLTRDGSSSQVESMQPEPDR